MEKKENSNINLNILPDILMNNILSYLCFNNLYNLNKLYYNIYHKKIYNKLNKKKIEYFNRLIIRKDYYYIFNYLLEENAKKWIFMKKYNYKNIIFSNYLMFLYNYSIENNSYKIKELLKNYFDLIGLSKNLHKKKIIKYIRCKI